MDEKIKKLLKSVEQLGYKLKDDDNLKKRERKKLKREWKLKDQELMKYLIQLEMKMRNLEREGRTEERKKLSEEYRTIMKISYNSHPNIPQSWNPLRIQRIIEEVIEKAQEKELGKNIVKKDISMIKMDNEKFKRLLLRARFRELALINPDPNAVRTMLLAFKDWDEGRIDGEMLKKIIKEHKESANPLLSAQEFTEKYMIVSIKLSIFVSTNDCVKELVIGQF